MEPPDSRNLDLLVSSFQTAGRYIFLPAIMGAVGAPPKILSDVGILKRELIVRPAWQIGDNDPDFSALSLDDDPIVPEGVTDPPVERLFDRLRKR